MSFDRPRKQPFLIRQGILDHDLRLVIYTVWMSLATAVFKEVVGTETIAFIGTFNFTVVEPVIGLQVLAIVALARRRALRPEFTTWLVLGIAAIIVINLFRGIEYNLLSGIRSFRIQGAFALFLAMCAFLPRDEKLLRQIRDAIIVFGLMLCALVAMRVVLGPQLFLRVQVSDISTINDGGRPVSADGALMIGAALILASARVIENVRDRFSRYARLAVPVLFVALVFTAQATATISSLVGLMLLVALHPGPNRVSRMLAVTVVAVCAGLFYLFIIGVFGQFSLDFLPQYFQHNLLRRSSTIEVRHMIWAGLMNDFWGWSLNEQLIGLRNNDLPFIFMPVNEGYYWWVSVHSMYYGSLVFMGVVGLVLYVILVLIVFLRGFARIFEPRADWGQFGGAIPLALLAAFSVFGHSYELRDEHTILILVAIVASRPLLRERRRDQELPFR